MDVRELVDGVSYAKFAALAKRKDWSAEYLAEQLRGKFEVRGETFEHYFERVLRCEPSPDVAIPFRSAIAKFLAAVGELARDGKLGLCACGCGSYAGGGNRLAWDSCVARPVSEAKRRAIEKAAAARRGKPGFDECTVSPVPIETRAENVHLAGTSRADL